ncbi:hypothetical protein N7450_005783 [Penicillium hetheringtonii]|uniref:Beta-lactamase-related domain-containing protein n=1 Tax=Penicillium hetheringtonii TaxID=911720 RepID=A0AAD6GTE3_9EURO|nr:hypothetical protein N7450_005783 [Penicillium hetheringtonii]
MPLDKDVTDRLRAVVNRACEDQESGIPGTTVVVVGKDGEELFAHSSGKRGIVSNEPMTLENIFWMASCTKVLVGVACMQLVEQGILSLDDGEETENLCPELKTLEVLKADGSFENKKRAITLRMLLTHTAGFGYSFFSDRLREWSYPTGMNEFSGRKEDFLAPPYFSSQVKGGSMDKDMRNRLAFMHTKSADGKLAPRDHVLQAPLVIDPDNKADVAQIFNSGGAGMFAKPQDYCKVLAVLLNDGTCPKTGTQILRKETVDEMFTNQVPQFPNFSRQGTPASKPDLVRVVPELYPVAGNPPQGWGLTFMMSNGGMTGRSKSTGHWAGIANLWWWADREKGVAGLVCTQILPFGDAQVLDLWTSVESEIYKALGQ